MWELKMEIELEQIQALARLASYPDEGEPGNSEYDRDVAMLGGIEMCYFLAMLARPSYKQIQDAFPKKTEVAALVLDQLAIVDANAGTRASTSSQTVATLQSDWQADPKVREWGHQFNIEHESQFFEVVTNGILDWIIEGLSDRIKQLPREGDARNSRLNELRNLFVEQNESTKHWPAILRRPFNSFRYLQIEDPKEIGKLLALDERSIIGQLKTCEYLLEAV
jgi:hypothetical protein